MVYPYARRLVWLAGATGVVATLLLAMAIAQHGSHGMFQVVRPVPQYAALLVERSSVLRAEMFVDNLFVCLYASFFLLLPKALTPATASVDSDFSALASRRAAAALLLTAVLDAAENAHLLSLMVQALQGQDLSQTAINMQAAASQVKFLASYAGLFLLSFALDGDGWAERGLSLVLRWVQAPVGVAIFVAQPPLLVPLYFLRAVFFALGMVWIAWVLHERGSRAN